MQQLRDYQQQALDELRRGIAAGHKTQVLMAPTGAGKTTIASAMKQGAMLKGKRAFFVVDSLELVEQAVARFEADGLEVGVIQGQHELTNYAKPVQVCTIQTLRARWDRICEAFRPDLLVIDECHVLHKDHVRIIQECVKAGVPVIGLSATPFRKGLGLVFERLVVTATLRSLTEQGYLVPALCYAPSVPDLTGVKSNGGDWVEDALAEVMGDAKLIGDVVENWCRLAEGRQTIVFGCNVAHSRELARQFSLAGVRAAHVDGYTDIAERTQIIDAFRAGRIRVLCNVAVLTKGFDAPETACVVLARPTKSLMMHYQMMGRGLRTADGKADCIIIDHAGNCLRNGLPTDDLPAELDQGKGDNPDRKKRDKVKAEREPRPCGKCGYVFSTSRCPACGHQPLPHQDVEWVDGKLVPLGEVAKRKTFTTDQRREVYAQLLWYARSTGKKDGWAYYKCQEYTGHAPRDKKGVTPIRPSQEVMGWIKHKNIAFAKSRESQRAAA